jgi:hypothetical protein
LLARAAIGESARACASEREREREFIRKERAAD